ncbi:MAG: hypothetical protein EAZ20_03675 [Bacteroidetes bacterium]|nr:MAG: hypothetical protein EAZ20_03675 [Bacteroidota bacterium]
MQKIQNLTIYKMGGSPASGFKALINPNSISYEGGVEYSDVDVMGTFKASPQYARHKPEKISFTVMIDTTGAVPDVSTKDSVKVAIQKLQKVIYNYVSSTHQPNVVTVKWGNDLSFNGRIENMSVNYKFFKPDGTAIRADINLSFIVYHTKKQNNQKKNSNSPDLTHLILVKEGDNLPDLCEKIYGDSSLYLEIAKVNGLVNFRKLNAGDELTFPPIEK